MFLLCDMTTEASKWERGDLIAHDVLRQLSRGWNANYRLRSSLMVLSMSRTQTASL